MAKKTTGQWIDISVMGRGLMEHPPVGNVTIKLYVKKNLVTSTMTTLNVLIRIFQKAKKKIKNDLKKY